MSARLSAAMVRMLENCEAGRRIDAGLFGRSQWGGATRTIGALLKRGLIYRNEDKLTPQGVDALAQHRREVQP